MYNFTIPQSRRLSKPSSSLLLLLFLFTSYLQASNSDVDLNFYYVVGEVKTATEPRMTCSDATPDNLILVMNGGSAVLDNDNFDDGDPDCNYGFAIPPNDSTFDSSLTFEDPGMHDAYFYILGPTANSTPLGPCPFDLTVENASPTNFDRDIILPGLTVFPNPLRASVFIEPGDNILNRVTLFDVNGAMIKDDETKVQEIDMSHLPKGTYFLRIYTGKGEVQKKIVKQ